jgi:integrase
MPRARPPHLHREITRHGKAVWYVRVGHGPRVRLKAKYCTPRFFAEYQAALAGLPEKRKAKTKAQSLAWLIARYRETTAWSTLSAATRRQRDNIFKGVITTAGDEPFAHVTKATIMLGKERRANTPHQARNFLDAMRGLFRWAHAAELIKDDPTVEVKNPERKKGVGFIPWTEDHVLAYQKRWPLGTRQKVWLDVLLYTGLRRGDAVRLGRQHVRAGFIKTEKTGLEVAVVILPILKATLDAGPCGDLAFIVGENGHPLTKESFGNEFKMACKAAGVPGSAHGVRKLSATRMANNGATEAELMAVFGWTDPKMAAHYTRTANRKRLAERAMNRMETSLPSPYSPASLTQEKNK